MKTRILFSLMTLIFLISCSPQENATVETPIPELLQRPEALQYGKEWDEVQNQYAAYKNNIRQHQKVAESYLNLAALFTTEARITGEHGHYYQAALKMVDRGLAETGLTKDLQFLGLATKAGVLMSQHEFQKALVTAEEAIRINDHNAMIYGILVDAHVELGQYPEAIEAADKMVSIRPDLRSYSRVSYIRELIGRHDGAIDAMQLAVDAGAPGSEEKAWAQLQLAGLYERKGDRAAALAISRAIVEERPEYPFALANIGRLEILDGDTTAGVAMLEKACTIIPEVSFFVELAKYHKAAGHIEAADALRMKILAMIDDDIRSGHKMDLELGHVYADLFGDYSKAISYIEKEYQLRPSNVVVNRALADVYEKAGDHAKALFHQQKANWTELQDGEVKTSERPYAALQ